MNGWPDPAGVGLCGAGRRYRRRHVAVGNHAPVIVTVSRDGRSRLQAIPGVSRSALATVLVTTAEALVDGEP